MWPRKLLDIEWSDLLHGARHCVWTRNDSVDEDTVLNCFGGENRSMVCLSVRSGFDLLLQCLNLPNGSEVLMSAVTIPDMVRIVRHHNLVPVPVDLDFCTLDLSPAALKNAISDRTRLIVIASLFGTTASIEPIIALAREKNIIVVEDCAQSFRGWDSIELPRGDVALYSFGPIKTSTALGGAVAQINDATLLSEMKRLHESYPRQSRLAYAKRVMKYSALKLASMRPLYSWVMALLKILGNDADTIINRLAKNFSPGDLITRIRVRPARALVAVLARRRRRYLSSRIDIRIRLGRSLSEQLRGPIFDGKVEIPGIDSPSHSYWVFPIKMKLSQRAHRYLNERGFDVTTQHNLTVIDQTRESCLRDAPVMRELFSRIVFIPLYPELSATDTEAIADSLRECCSMADDS